MPDYPQTQDGRYFVVRGRLWRMSDPALSPDRRAELVKALMEARRRVRDAKRKTDPDAMAAARRAVDQAKRALGERGPAWWTDGAPDYNRRLIENTPYVAADLILPDGRLAGEKREDHAQTY